jgi:GTPase
MTKKENKEESALSVNKGINQPPSINPNSGKQIKKFKRKPISLEQYVDGILNSDRTILSQAITLTESALPEHHEIAQQIIEKCLPHKGKSVRIGITGVPGVGKSTFIESFGKHLTNNGNKLAVLAIDPSSERSKGSILGDKTRMEQLAIDSNAFIRPSPSAGSLGGVARKTRESVLLCEAAGFNIIIIETVGVGQSETAVHSMVDFFLLLMLAGAGDELQGIKRGIMEMADLIAITKADGNNIEKAKLAKIDYQNALHLFPPTPSNWIPKVVTCSSLTKTGISDIWTEIDNYCNLTKKNNYFHARRKEQAKYWMYETINDQLKSNFHNNHEIMNVIKDIESQVLNDKISSFIGAKILLDTYFKSNNNSHEK